MAEKRQGTLVPARYTCSPDEDVLLALETMKQHRVRRLPVAGPPSSRATHRRRINTLA